MSPPEMPGKSRSSVMRRGCSRSMAAERLLTGFSSHNGTFVRQDIREQDAYERVILNHEDVPRSTG